MENILRISELLGLKKIENGYEGVFVTGNFDQLYDYEAGLLTLSIRAFFNHEQKWLVQLALSTVDDGGWEAWDEKTDYSLEDARNRVEEIKNHLQGKMGYSKKLPTEQKLNTWLREINLWGVYTG